MCINTTALQGTGLGLDVRQEGEGREQSGHRENWLGGRWDVSPCIPAAMSFPISFLRLNTALQFTFPTHKWKCRCL